MQALQRWMVCMLVAVALVGCDAASLPGLLKQTSVPPTVTPTVTASPTPLPTASPTVTPSPMPTATPTATPFPTPDPARLLATANTGLAQLQAVAGEQTLLCLRYEDTDVDGAAEWVALVHQESTPARLSAFILDEDTSYWLEPAYPKPGVPDVGLGQYATCEIEIQDVNVDGVPEIAIFGHAEKNKTLLHLFAWNGADYQRLGRFSGDAGVRFVDADGDLELEIWEGYRDQAAPELAWYVVHTWEEQTYGWTSEHYDWYAIARPHAYPTHKAQYAVISFYLALDDRDLPGAYDLLVPLDERDYETWALGYTTTVGVSVGGVHPIPSTVTASSARVTAMVTSWDNAGGMIVGRLWNVEWGTVSTESGWRLTTATAEKLEEWPVSYWP